MKKKLFYTYTLSITGFALFILLSHFFDSISIFSQNLSENSLLLASLAVADLFSISFHRMKVVSGFPFIYLIAFKLPPIQSASLIFLAFFFHFAYSSIKDKTFDIYRLFLSAQFALVGLSGSYVFREFESINLILALLLSGFVIKIVNSVLVDILYYGLSTSWRTLKALIDLFTVEISYILISLPIVVLYKNVSMKPLAYHLVPIYITFLIILTLSFYTRAEESRVLAESGRRKLKMLYDRLLEILKIFKSLKIERGYETILGEIAYAIREKLNFELVLISLYDHKSGMVKRIAHAGLPPEEFERLKNKPPTIEMAKTVMDERFRVSNSYFIPYDKIILDDHFYIPDIEMEEGEDAWHPGDNLLVPIIGFNDREWGYISVDKPRDGKIPKLDVIRVLEIFADQAALALENASKYKEVELKSIKDQMLDLYSHTYFYQYAERLLRKYESMDEEETIAFMMMDVDNFKEFNDRYGHKIGDIVLKKVAKAVTSSVRSNDFVARYGGDEIIVILENVGVKRAQEIAERIYSTVASIEIEECSASITVSIGIAIYPVDGESVSDLVSAADEAMYRAKWSNSRISFANKAKSH